jgi:hypothetical protein
VGPLKQARLRRLAAIWFAIEGGAASNYSGQGRAGRRPGGPVRFDVACVLAGVVDVIEGAF